ncbi:signal peptidase I [Antribacter gilvus]|uniref:signal peptidase I n=1 Tax=Antribacter gilvus TaxID=2304675 RepID=UPI000F7B0DC4|nr:signal peptidase I [Antribacter gilvus]
MGDVLRVAGRALALVLLVAAGAALLAGVLVPRLAGATPYVVTSGSMRPALPAGTLVVVRPADPSTIRIGDVVTYQLRSGDPQVATHRVVGVGSTTTGERTLVTRGDANTGTDPHPVREAQVRGVLWYHVPYLGRVSVLLSPAQREAATTGLVVLLLGYAAWQVVGAVRARRSRAAEPEPAPVAAAAFAPAAFEPAAAPEPGGGR